MKRTILLLAACFMLSFDISVSAQEGSLAQVYVQSGWQKAREGQWQGNYEGTTYYYKMQDGVLKRSRNGNSWSNVDEAMWMDDAGRWVRVNDNTLMWSEDNGKLWVPVPQREWRGSDGKSYKFDGGWTVWYRERQ